MAAIDCIFSFLTMIKRIFFLLIFLIFLFGLSYKLKAQSIPANTPVFDDYYRRMQLLTKIDSNISFTIRPIFPQTINDIYDPDSSLQNDHWNKTGPITFGNGHGMMQILPLSWQQQYNSNHPYGLNDGPLIPAKGYQTIVSGGIYLKYGPLSVQLRPEYVYASNPKFDGFVSPSRTDENYRAYYTYHNLIDVPEGFGFKAYSKLFLGQSSVRLTFGAISFGISNENLWWGPGIQNALIITNNAPGFKHITINTSKPVKTFLGYFEGQIISGRLDGSGLAPLTLTSLSSGENLYDPKPADWRYFSGLNVNYHIKWITGLTLGFTRTFDAYEKGVKGFSGYFPFFVPYQKQNTNNGDPFPRDQYTSGYARWLFTRAKAEVYFEYGLNDNSYNFRDFIGSPEHSRAYIFGIRKMLLLDNLKDKYILFGAEITQLSQSPDRIVRDAQGWYQHGAVRDGQTNQGQVLGAGIGSGGNLQSMEISWLYKLKKLGISLERYEHNVDFATNAFKDINGNSRKWVDVAFAFKGEWNYKNIIFNTKLQEIKSLNYQWILQDYDPAKYHIPHNNVFNFHGELGLTYRF